MTARGHLPAFIATPHTEDTCPVPGAGDGQMVAQGRLMLDQPNPLCYYSKRLGVMCILGNRAIWRLRTSF